MGTIIINKGEKLTAGQRLTQHTDGYEIVILGIYGRTAHIERPDGTTDVVPIIENEQLTAPNGQNQ